MKFLGDEQLRKKKKAIVLVFGKISIPRACSAPVDFPAPQNADERQR